MSEMQLEEVRVSRYPLTSSPMLPTQALDVAMPKAPSLPIDERAVSPMKRVLDVAGSLFGLIVLSPLFLTVAAVVKIESPGSGIFAQERVGRNGRSFKMLKFRTMRVEASCDAHRQHMTKLITQDAACAKGEDGTYKMEQDPRVTRVGRVLRRTSLDELPQLVNVLRGEMSLVGPRPPLDYEVELYSPRHMRRLEVLPGMTGLWQVSGRTRLDFEQMVDLDLQYIENWSIRLDLRILWRTVFVVLTREGAW